MFPASKLLFRPVLLASLVLALVQTPAFAQRRMAPMMMPQMMPNSMSAMPSFNGLYGNGAMPFATGNGTFASGYPLGTYGLAYGLGYGGYSMGGYGAYGPYYGMAQAGSYGLPGNAAYADTPDYSSRGVKDSDAGLETALRANAKPDTLSNAEKAAKLRKRMERYLYATEK
jgi:hypothetical protein